MRQRPDVLIIGAGVSGLTTALCVARMGLAVLVYARELPLETTSSAAAGMWAPYRVTDTRLMRWSEQTLDDLNAFDSAAGVRRLYGREVTGAVQPAPQWMRGLPRYRDCVGGEVPAGYAAGWWYETAVVDMPVYLQRLQDLLAELAVPIHATTVASIRDALAVAPVVVNCTGAGARQLVADRELRPERGQLVEVKNPGIEEFFAEHDECDDTTYIIPHGDRLVLGGSAEPDTGDRTPNFHTAAAILRRCAAIEPAIRRAPVIGHRVGVRPARSTVRLERVAVDAGHVVHNYGHGGAGVTLSWGCAREAALLVAEAVGADASEAGQSFSSR